MAEARRDAPTRQADVADLFVRFFERNRCPACLAATDGTVRAANRALAGLLGLERGALDGRKLESFLHPDDRAPFRDWLAAHAGLPGGEAEGSWRLLAAAGPPRAERFVLSATDPASGSVLLEVLESTDTGELARRLADNEKRLEDLTEAAADWFWETDEEHRYTWFSRRVEDYIDFPREWHYGRSRIELGQPREPDPAWQAHLAQLEAREPFRDVLFHRIAPDGERWIHSSGVPVFDADGRFRGYRGSGTDVSELYRARRRAATVQEHLSNAVNSVAEGMLVFDAEDRLVLCNDHFRDNSPWLADMLVPGTSYRAIVERVAAAGLPEETTATERADWLARRLSLDGVKHRSMEFRARDGSWARVTDHRIEQGGRVVLRTDITELKQRQFELENERNRAEAASRAKSEFLANMSHELRTPLNGIIGFADVMIDGLFGPISERYQGYARDIAISGRHLLDLISDILDLARIESGQMVLDRQAFPLLDAVDQCLSLVAVSADAKHLTLAFDSDSIPADERIEADPRAFRQILLNLLSNAIKFSDDGERIDLEIRLTPSAFELAVRDRGRGIAATDLARVFERFVQVENHLNRQHEGIGIGLPLSRALAELHGGRLELESEIGVGTVATLTLPRRRPGEPARAGLPNGR